MARPRRLESRASLQVVAGCMSVVLHAGLLLLIAFPGGRQLGLDDQDDAPAVQLVMLDDLASDTRRLAMLAARASPELLAARGDVHLQLLPIRLPPPWRPELQAPEETPASPPEAPLVDEDFDFDFDLPAVDLAPTIPIPRREAVRLLERIERVARSKLPDRPRARTKWSEDGTRYEATLVLERDRDRVEADRVVAEVTAESEGRRQMTRLMLRRLTYAQFAQVIDHWDPTVQMHDDEVIGPTHINTRFNVLSDDEARPALRGRVSTAAQGFTLRSVGATREADVFREGLRTGARRITLAEQVDPLEWTPGRLDARVHEFDVDTSIRFYADGSYTWAGDGAGAAPHRREATASPVYFVASPGVTLAVQGTVAGRVLVYSPQRIVVAGSLTYAHDPRAVPASDDYLGLVCDRDIEVAPATVTGPGDLDIQAALFARRRFVVADYDRPPSATLRILGSLAAGSVSATEPRYATRIEFDQRFERRRPPGFPSMNRYAADEWDRRWVELPQRAAADVR